MKLQLQNLYSNRRLQQLLGGSTIHEGETQRGGTESPGTMASPDGRQTQSIGGMTNGRGRSYHTTTLSITNPIWTTLRLKPDQYNDRPAANHLSYGMAHDATLTGRLTFKDRSWARSLSSNAPLSSTFMGSPSLLGDVFISMGSLAASSFTRSAYRSVLRECSHELMPGLIIAIYNPEWKHSVSLHLVTRIYGDWHTLQEKFHPYFRVDT
jgi:hypothetical protein